MSLNDSAAKARQKRIERGIVSERAARKHTMPASLQGLLQLPLLEELEQCGGKARPGEIYARLAERMGLSSDALEHERHCGNGRTYRVFEQQVRWTRQTAVMQGLITNAERGIWELADPAYEKLLRARRGQLVLIYSLDEGLALWGHAEDAAGAIEKGSISLIMLSPPYPTISRKYGKMSVPEWLSWMRRLTMMWKELLAADGTLAVNLMDCFVPGSPAISPFQERYTLSTIDDVGLHLAGRHFWHSPTKLGNINWTAKARVRPKNTIEQILLFSKSPNPNWDIDRLPRGQYAPRTPAQIKAETGATHRWSAAAPRSPAPRPSWFHRMTDH